MDINQKELNDIYKKIVDNGCNIFSIFINNFYIEQELYCIIIPSFNDMIHRKTFISYKLFINNRYVNIIDIRIFFNKLVQQDLFALQFFNDNLYIVNEDYKEYFSILKLIRYDVINYDKFMLLTNIYYETEYIKNKIDKKFEKDKFVDINLVFYLFRLRYFLNNITKDKNYLEALDEINITKLKNIIYKQYKETTNMLLFPILYNNIISLLKEYEGNNKFMVNYRTYKKIENIESKIIIKSIHEKELQTNIEFC